ncbi:aspartyl/asparaginyl beta-hydroxylase domain-containing protein [Oscillatoria salina]|uniref:aspartyl/asparaginyl beta-hydroxylase domain-containing protein n=1 Tax=Oscillatoria salina TaxID=331517 RepID=UPI001CCA8EDB|nr:aspartyl/asparaginyl beta-hydroxylase domain-containing protein [Oscillatoria salina]MBZ8182536.1 aspartyl/asparaginyl beta-hydroxylase domain-containing protein [Oscillatoria salina IIICB1]
MNQVLPKTQKDQASPKKAKTVRELGQIDISGIREDVLNLPAELWEKQDYDKPNKFKPLGRTEHIVFQFVRDYDNHIDTVNYPIWDEWKSRLEPILAAAVEPYGYENAEFCRIMFAKLPAHSKIALHIDPYKSSNYTHKIHIPIVTNPDVEFIVGHKRYHFAEGYAYEVNNKDIHGGVNAGDSDRIHLIFEYYEK